MIRKKIIISSIASLCVLLVGAGIFYFIKFKNGPVEKNQVQQNKNYFEINDEASGIYFRIGKKFERMPARDLQIKNASFIYGFFASDDRNVNCYISQTKRINAGVVKVVDLQNGVLEQLKKIYADTKLNSGEIVDVGENNNKGAKLKMSYTDGDIPKFQWEIAGITEKNATFAFCEFPQAVIDLYQEDINLFLDSIKLK